MKSKKVWRYYCDFCKKSGCNKYHLAKHEKHCTLNPARHCRMCEVSDGSQKPIPELIKVLLSSEGIEALKEATDYCPACTLAAFRQGREQYEDQMDLNEHEKNIPFTVVLDYDAMKIAFWDRVHKKDWEADHGTF